MTRSNRPRGLGAQGRHFWREQSHRQSHEAAGPGPVATHPLASADEPAMVATDAGLAEAIAHLRAEGSFAFDSEFIGERSYTPHLCLVQLATTRRVFIVDPLARLDLGPLWELLCSQEIEKIVLAGQQDFLPAVAHCGRPPAGVIDAQVAAGLVHCDYPLSLWRLVKEFVGVELGKGLTFTHWDNRPLSAVQLRYAADDVRYLPAAWRKISEKLQSFDRLAWRAQECAETLGDLSLYKSPPEALYLRVRGRDRLGRRQLAVLREPTMFRDDAARREDLPARTLLKDGLLVTMSRRRRRSCRTWGR